MISPGLNGTASGERIKTGILFTLGSRGAIFTKIGVVKDEESSHNAAELQKPRRFLPFQRLYNKTQPLVRAVAAHQRGNVERARQLLWHISHADERLFLAVIEYQSKNAEHSIKLMESAFEHPEQIGKYFYDYEIPVSIGIQLGETTTQHFGPEYRSFLMIYAELCLEIGTPQRAVPALKSYLHSNPADQATKLYVARYLAEAMTLTDENARYIIGITDQLGRKENLDGELHLYRAKAMIRLKLYFTAQEALQKVVDQRYMPAEILLKEGFYQLFNLYELQGRSHEAAKQLRQVYERDRGYRDVAERIQTISA